MLVPFFLAPSVSLKELEVTTPGCEQAIAIVQRKESRRFEACYCTITQKQLQHLTNRQKEKREKLYKTPLCAGDPRHIRDGTLERAMERNSIVHS
jgi:hypothetical protein